MPKRIPFEVNLKITCANTGHFDFTAQQGRKSNLAFKHICTGKRRSISIRPDLNSIQSKPWSWQDDKIDITRNRHMASRGFGNLPLNPRTKTVPIHNARPDERPKQQKNQ